MRTTPATVAFGLLVFMAVAQANGIQPAGVSDIDWAVSAAPPAIGARATVAQMSDNGVLTVLRNGDNGWTCLLHDPGTPLGHPLCLDRIGLAWMQSAMSGREPDPDGIGYSYMLKGGTSWSATDMTATSLPKGESDYIRIPPHIMIMNARIAATSGFPSGEAHPDTHKPFVMYGGTPFAIVMIPIE